MSSFPSAPILDNFNRANAGPPPSASWGAGIDVAAEPAHKVVSNQCSPTTVGTNAASYWTTPLGANSEAFLTVLTAGEIYRIWLRMQNPNTAGCFGYYGAFDLSGGGGVSFVRVDAGPAYNNLGNLVIAIPTGAQIGVRMIGTVLTAYVNGAQAGSVSDATYAATGMAGVRSTGVFDDFGGGASRLDFGEGIPLSMRGVLPL